MKDFLVHFAALTPEIILFVGMAFIVFLRLARPRMRPYAPWFGAGTVLIAAWHAAAWIDLPASMALREALRLDLWSLIGRIMVYILAGVALWSMGCGEADSSQGKRSLDETLLFLLAALGAGLVSASQDHLVTILGLAAVAFPAVAIAASRGDRVAAGRIFMMASVAIGLMLFGLALLFAERGHTRFGPFDLARARMMIGWLLHAIGLLLFLGIALLQAGPISSRRGSSATVPPFFVVALLVGLFMTLGRFLFWSQPGTPELIKVLIAISAAMIFLGFAPTLVERESDRLFRSFLLGHAGLLLMGAVASLHARNLNGLAALLISLVALAPALLAWRLAMDSAGGDGRLRGMGRTDPLAAAALLLVLLSLGGLPLTLGFMARFNLFAAAIQAGQVGLLGIAAINSLFSAWAALRLGAELFSGNEASPVLLDGARRVILIAVALFLLLAGLLPDGILSLSFKAVLGMIP
jgi:NADH-quinone oxidoreductase subunit N